jgi:hypothetical protein
LWFCYINSSTEIHEHNFLLVDQGKLSVSFDKIEKIVSNKYCY